MEGAIVEVSQTKFPSNTIPNGSIAYLDRDGVINIGSPNYINNPDELILLEGAAHSIGELKRSGFFTCIVTNQSAISRGLWNELRLTEIHSKMQELLLIEDKDAHIDLVITCPHRQIDRCNCRKPMPGMLHLGHAQLRGNLSLQDGLNVNVTIPKQVTRVNWWKDKPLPLNQLDFIVGDRKSDLGAGWARGIRLFKVNPNIGLAQVINRVVDFTDDGDIFQPVR
ncbi:MAG: HAD-IIIA family hydrolase [Candidatus Poseidoniaceae archaeon]